LEQEQKYQLDILQQQNQLYNEQILQQQQPLDLKELQEKTRIRETTTCRTTTN